MSSHKHRGRAHLPYAFAEQGVAMLSSVLRSPRAISVFASIRVDSRFVLASSRRRGL